MAERSCARPGRMATPARRRRAEGQVSLRAAVSAARREGRLGFLALRQVQPRGMLAHVGQGRIRAQGPLELAFRFLELALLDEDHPSRPRAFAPPPAPGSGGAAAPRARAVPSRSGRGPVSGPPPRAPPVSPPSARSRARHGEDQQRGHETKRLTACSPPLVLDLPEDLEALSASPAGRASGRPGRAGNGCSRLREPGAPPPPGAPRPVRPRRARAGSCRGRNARRRSPAWP